MSNLTPLAQVIRLQGWGAQRRIARELGISESHFSRIVNGLHVDDATRQRIAHALGRQVSDLWPSEPEARAA